MRRPTPGYNMDSNDTTPGARQRAKADQVTSYSALLGLGSLGTAAASRVRATASPGVPNVLMSTPAAFTQQHHGEGGEALSRPSFPQVPVRLTRCRDHILARPRSHTTHAAQRQASSGSAPSDGVVVDEDGNVVEPEDAASKTTVSTHDGDLDVMA